MIIQTRSGRVAGTHQRAPDGAGYRRWLGVPYAKAERFGAPERPSQWHGVREASTWGAQCPQQLGRKLNRKGLASGAFAEDCLFLNVWTPDGGALGPKPVLVWFHGGAFMVGGSNMYDGWQLALEGDVIVVTVNYRLGVFGFVNFGEALDLPDIPSNLGLRDHIAALQWVRDNIAVFGGDPDKVTISGESAGSITVALLMLSSAARGLFRGAIMQSGGVSMVHDRVRSVSDAHRFAEVLGLSRDPMDQLRKMDVTTLLEAQAEIHETLKPRVPAAPWYDGDLLPGSRETAVEHDAAPVPLIAGWMREEIRLFHVYKAGLLPTERAELEKLVRAQLPAGHADRVLAVYPRGKAGDIALGTDLSFVIPTRNFAHRHSRTAPTWAFRFDYDHPVLGAAHGLDLGMMWPFTGLAGLVVRGGPNTRWRKALGSRMRAHWTHFTRHGTPGHDWPVYTEAIPTVRLFGREDRIADAPDAERFDVWNGFDANAWFSVAEHQRFPKTQAVQIRPVLRL